MSREGKALSAGYLLRSFFINSNPCLETLDEWYIDFPFISSKRLSRSSKSGYVKIYSSPLNSISFFFGPSTFIASKKRYFLIGNTPLP